MDQLDRVGLRRLPVLDQSKADRVEAGETLVLGDGLEDGRRDVAIGDDGEGLVLEKVVEVLCDE